MTTTNTSTTNTAADISNPLSSIIGRADIAAIRDEGFKSLMSLGASGVLEMFRGFEQTRKGWLQTVAVCVVLYSRQDEQKIRDGLIAPQSKAFKNSLVKNPTLSLDHDHLIVALNSHIKSGGGEPISGSAKTRLKEAVYYICRLGTTLEARLEELDRFKSLNELLKEKRDEARGEVSEPRDAGAEVALLNGKVKFARQHYLRARPKVASFTASSVNGHEPLDGLWIAVCRSTGSSFEVVRLDRQDKVIDAVMATMTDDQLIKDDREAANANAPKGVAA